KESDVQVVVMGSDMAPLLTGQVDAVTGWLTNASALKPLGPDRVDMRLWDAGIQLYANLYYATDETLQKHADVLAGFTRAAAKGWAYTRQNPDKAVDLLVKAYPNLDRDAEMDAIKPVLGFSFTKTTAAKGWGTMEPSVWEQQIHVYDELQQFKGQAPKVADVMTESILTATAAARPKLGGEAGEPPRAHERRPRGPRLRARERHRALRERARLGHGAGERRPQGGAGRVRQPPRPLGMRQVDLAAARRRPRAADPGYRVRPRRTAGARAAQPRARLRLPGRDPPA